MSMTTVVDPNKVALVFEEAAQYIEKYGWWSSAMPNEPKPVDDEAERIPPSACISNAASFGATEVASEFDNALHLRAQEILMEHLGVTEIGQVFDLNDSQPLDSGKEWAIAHLRTIATHLKTSTR